MGRYWSVDEARWVEWSPPERRQEPREDAAGESGSARRVTVPSPRAGSEPAATAAD